MNKWQREINRYAKYRGHHKRFKYRNFKKCRINLRRNIKKYGYTLEQFRMITTNYINKHNRIFDNVEQELNVVLNY